MLKHLRHVQHERISRFDRSIFAKMQIYGFKRSSVVFNLFVDIFYGTNDTRILCRGRICHLYSKINSYKQARSYHHERMSCVCEESQLAGKNEQHDLASGIQQSTARISDWLSSNNKRRFTSIVDVFNLTGPYGEMV